MSALPTHLALRQKTTPMNGKKSKLVSHEKKEAESEISPRLRLLDLNQVIAATGESRSVIFDKMKQGLFPKPIKIGRRNRWREITLIRFLERKDQKAGNYP
jgi:predicted DNA-binding transcriptional regulator AlpA